MENIVTTVSGKRISKKDCRKMQGIYYQKGDVTIENSGECYYINGKYYKYNTGYIIYNHSKKQYMIKSTINNLIEKGIIGFNENNNPIFGAFEDKNDLVTLYYNEYYYKVIDENLINPNYYLESLEDGIFYKRSSKRAVDFIYPKECNQNNKRNLPYDSRGILKKNIKLYNKLYEPNFCKVLNYFEENKIDLTEDLTFGLEFETTKGYIPDRITSKLGLLPLRDGSIKGLEFVTIPLSGNKGLQCILDTLDELNKRTEFNNDCSLHLHIGNLPRTEKFFIAMFKILYILQDKIFDLFPLHKKHNYGVKRKAYTKPLPLDTMLKLDNKINSKNIVENFDHIFQFLSLYQRYSEVNNSLDNVTHHPSDPGNNSKWNIKSRYYWVNLIPLLFGNKETIEFRIHTPTYDKNKVMYFMFLCFSIVSYVKKYQDKILKDFNSFVNVNFNDILLDVYHAKSIKHNLYGDMQRYFDRRNKHFYHKTSQGDFIANENEFTYSNIINFNKKELESSIQDLKINKSFVKEYEHINFNIERVQANIRDMIRPDMEINAPNNEVQNNIEL